MSAKIRLATCDPANIGTVPPGKVVIFQDPNDNKLKAKKDDQSIVNLEDTDVLVGVTSADTTPGYLFDKVSGVGMTIQVLNPGANEVLELTADMLSFNGRTGAVTQDVFQATQQTVQTPVSSIVPLLMQATNITASGSYTYSAITGELTINRASRFRFTITCSADTANGARQTSRLSFQRFNGAVFVDIPTAEGPSEAWGYHRNNASGENTSKISCVLDVTAGQRFRPMIECTSAGTISTIPAGTSLLVEEI